VLSTTEDSRLVELGLEKGSMTLVDLEAQSGSTGPWDRRRGFGRLGGQHDGRHRRLGGSAGFVGKVADDPLGEVFIP